MNNMIFSVIALFLVIPLSIYFKRRIGSFNKASQQLINAFHFFIILSSVAYLYFKDLSFNEFVRVFLGLYFPVLFIVFEYYLSIYQLNQILIILALEITILHIELTTTNFQTIIDIYCSFIYFDIIIYIIVLRINELIIYLQFDRLYMVIMTIYAVSLFLYSSISDIFQCRLLLPMLQFLLIPLLVITLVLVNLIYFNPYYTVLLAIKSSFVVIAVSNIIKEYIFVESQVSFYKYVVIPLLIDFVCYISKVDLLNQKIWIYQEIEGDTYRINWRAKTAELIKKSSQNPFVRDTVTYDGIIFIVNSCHPNYLYSYDLNSIVFQNETVLLKTKSEKISNLTLDCQCNARFCIIARSFPNLNGITTTERCRTHVSTGHKLYSLNSAELLFCARKASSVTISIICTCVGSYSFYECVNLKYVSFPSSITEIKNEAFKYCRSLKRIKFQKDSKLRAIGNGAFSFTDLQVVNFPKSLEFLGLYVFYNCLKLKKITFPIRIKMEGFDLNMIGIKIDAIIVAPINFSFNSKKRINIRTYISTIDRNLLISEVVT